MKTDRLYYTDPYLSRFDAEVLEIADEGRRVYLDRTAFYPTSGGQPHDIGFCNGIEVSEIVDEGTSVAHVLSRPLQRGPVHCEIDWSRRYDHMQQHTGQHLLSAIFHDLLAIQTLSFHLGAEVSTIELATPQLLPPQVEAVENRAAELIGQDLPVKVSFESAEEVGGLRKESSRTGTLRIIEIENVDRSACGGTHVRSTAELGLIVTRRHEKLRGNVRLEFVCGFRCLRRAREDFRLLSTMSRQAAVSVEDLPGAYKSIAERLASAEKDRARLAVELARREGLAKWESTTPCQDGLRRASTKAENLNEESRALAQGFVEKGKAAILISCLTPPSLLFAVSNDSGVNAGALLKQSLQIRSGRGGGNSAMAQGTAPTENDLQAVAQELGFTS